MAMPMVSSALQKGSFFEVSSSCSFVLPGRRGTLVGAILLRRFHTMRSSFRGRRSSLATSIVISRGRRSTLDVSCCAFFFANRMSGLHQVVTRCKFRGRCGVL